MQDEEKWKSVRSTIESLIVEASGRDARTTCYLRRKIEHWAIDQGSGRVATRKTRLKKLLFASQHGLCAACDGALVERHFELDRIDSRFADDEDQGYREGSVRAVDPHCNPHGPFPGGRGPR